MVYIAGLYCIFFFIPQLVVWCTNVAVNLLTSLPCYKSWERASVIDILISLLCASGASRCSECCQSTESAANIAIQEWNCSPNPTSIRSVNWSLHVCPVWLQECSDITVRCRRSNHTGLWKMYIVLVVLWERLRLEYRDSILSDNSHHSSLGLFRVLVGRVKPAGG